MGPRHATLRGGGDCADFAALALSVLHAARVDADMMVGLSCAPTSCDGHAWVEGLDEYGYFLVEATSGRIHRNEHPVGYVAQISARAQPRIGVRDPWTRQRAAEMVALQYPWSAFR